MINSSRFRDAQSIIDSIPNPIFVKNRAHRIVLLNDSAAEFFGYSREILLASSDEDLFPNEEVRVFHEADDAVFGSGADVENEEQITDATGRVRNVLTRKRMARLNGTEYLVSVITDITAYREAEAHNRYMAFHDALTGLPNRALLKERIEQALLRKVHRCALLYIDLDRFKEVNDTHGHPVGDELIRQFADRLTAIVRASDTVARLGGDEFAILLADTTDELHASEVCLRTLIAASQAFELTGVQVLIGASIGMAFAGDGDFGQIELQRRADVALYEAKSHGRGCSRTFTAELDVSIRHRQRLEADLREALRTGAGLELHYQPLAGMASGRIEGFEALARWQHPSEGLIMPDEFIPIAEASGLIVKLGEWVLTQACADALEWDPPLGLSVNVSPVQFAYGDLAATIERVLKKSGLDPARLELEITEGVLIRDAPRGLALLSRIRALGVQIVLDDFGTGYSSLSYFRQFPFDKVKIDRSFIAEMLDSTHARSIVEAIISLGRGLNLKVVAEGVETQEQLALLQAQGCTQAQGYYISRPQPIGHFKGSVLREPSVKGAVDGSDGAPATVSALPKLAH
jgi:diguanylate cyclase (GGDEF)-like protein/PAS domain S-box-containing protein